MDSPTVPPGIPANMPCSGATPVSASSAPLAGRFPSAAKVPSDEAELVPELARAEF